MSATDRLSSTFPAAILWTMATVAAAAGAPGDDPAVTVLEKSGTYVVSASFAVPERAATVVSVLTDYSEIPRFMPEVESSLVLERSGTGVLVQQEAVARYLMFSKRIHLLLDIRQDDGTIRFRDRGGRSFARYEGAWTVVERDGATRICYELSAQPSFPVPEFLLKRLLERDAVRMIERLKVEIAARARRLTN